MSACAEESNPVKSRVAATLGCVDAQQLDNIAVAAVLRTHPSALAIHLGVLPNPLVAMRFQRSSFAWVAFMLNPQFYSTLLAGAAILRQYYMQLTAIPLVVGIIYICRKRLRMNPWDFPGVGLPTPYDSPFAS
jgi:hypothetical protein